MKVALVYDRINKWGGAERVLLALKEMFPDAPVYTSVYNPHTARWADVFTIIPSFLHKFPFARKRHELFATLMPLAFEGFTFDQYDLVISITSEAAKGIITKPHTKHLCICLTPTRYLWSGYDEYFKNPLLRFFSKPVVTYLRTWDMMAANRPDAYIAISGEVQKRIAKYYDRKSEIIYPALKFTVHGSQFTRNRKLMTNNYLLVVSRLVPYKRVDLAIQACNKLKLPLKIIGTGIEEKRLKALAGPTVEFLGNLTEEELIMYYQNSSFLLFPGKEDFGLSIVEAQSFGKPVLAYKAGGALETIIEGKTGEFFYPQTVNALAQKLQFLAKRGIFSPITLKKYKKACIQQAKKFSRDEFKKKIFFTVETMMRL